jgi:rubrerythrin
MPTIGLQPLDVIQLAIRLETNGAEFYGRAATAAADPELRSLWRTLAAREKEHAASLRATGGASIFRPPQLATEVDEAVAMFFDDWLKNDVLDAAAERARAIADRGDRAEIAQLALSLEKDSIAFYAGLRDLLDGEEAGALAEKLIRDELRHVVEVGRLLR